MGSGSDPAVVRCRSRDQAVVAIKRLRRRESWRPRLGCTDEDDEAETRQTLREEADVTTAVAPSSSLTASDRCDRCGAQAYLRVELQSGGELLFCAHHARQHGDKLKQVAVTYIDETDKLAGTPTIAPDGER
jgi:hypothetical protein